MVILNQIFLILKSVFFIFSTIGEPDPRFFQMVVTALFAGEVAKYSNVKIIYDLLEGRQKKSGIKVKICRLSFNAPQNLYRS